MPNVPAKSGGLSSVDNALHLLALLGDRRALRVAEAAEVLGVARSTAHRLLSALRAHGFAMQDKANGAYRPGPVLNEIGLAAIGRIDIRRVAQPVLQELRDETQETVSLSLLEGRDIRFIDCVEGTRSVRVGGRTGIVLPANCTAGGKALLAALSQPELARRYADQDLAVRTESSVGSWAELEKELDAIRQDGYAINLEEGEQGISAVATAVRDLTGAPLAAIAVVVPASRMDAAAARELAPRVMATAGAIQELLHAKL
ncbi:IclR family transcriptional regulator [Saccharopolyspora sp. K220]|uniref:IclR family transcriptional regulator n=1 Tax=Saccharopolyspora soli TaxID=2926618 RepID=UPI001F57177B|nr:IclR family transcriptional regulator [Saccharopolyspora soli]MCI2415985.1 IclR family transcriptional regulator [Saccharopolyspora soli]